MTKIEEYKHAKFVAEKIKRSADQALGRDDSRNDKHTFHASFSGLSSQQFSPMNFSIDSSYGYYGSSSGYSASSTELGKYLAMAITKHATLLLDEAVKMAAMEAETARKAAEDEARAVLTETAA